MILILNTNEIMKIRRDDYVFFVKHNNNFLKAISKFYKIIFFLKDDFYGGNVFFENILKRTLNHMINTAL